MTRICQATTSSSPCTYQSAHRCTSLVDTDRFPGCQPGNGFGAIVGGRLDPPCAFSSNAQYVPPPGYTTSWWPPDVRRTAQKFLRPRSWSIWVRYLSAFVRRAWLKTRFASFEVL